jgi:hypothetical protein
MLALRVLQSGRALSDSVQNPAYGKTVWHYPDGSGQQSMIDP